MKNQAKGKPQYWMLKTTAGGGPNAPDYWNDFCAENVVAIGWQEISLNPEKVSHQEILKRVISVFAGVFTSLNPDREAAYSARIINKFAKEWSDGDVVIICRGYSAKQKADVYLYGFAIVGKFLYKPDSEWWAFQRAAKIRHIGQYIPKEVFADSLTLQSARLAIHHITEAGFHNFSKEIQKHHPKLWHGVTTPHPIQFRD